ncbi:uncharacterized protein PFL1_02152 [Pseudozyma flocculosa PF-1]|uniref:Pheromone-processing carboxypeptidase KEX1 n=1 Tax=Pseudozyma flocculosa TaxID=84751 RepID=A0A5C3FB60_9BASI|nr:uncharacterized protein PFL1_02152 [Pseudozyma flocculosa PF-1]EPQ30034.1 hypothetical protein PFL1_02152 [Pseudozyma flocculosa PF-1]SPO41366.1 probable Pheromone-processing carboxypeptidase KEX1 [Pseudozyma flocculosa]
MPLIDPHDLFRKRGVEIPSAASFFVPGLPDLHDANNASSSSSSSSGSVSHPLHMSAGYLPARPPARSGDSVPKDDAHLYFLLLRARHTPPKRKLIIWFNGGPGCSSFDGAMMEVGAWRLDGNGGLVWAQDGGSWNEYADILFLDQPVGTGFSYVNTNGYSTTLTQAADEVVYFLQRFVEVFPEYGRDVETRYGSTGSGVDVYLAGESFAGQYIPYTASALLHAPRPPVSLKGIAIGNGFMDPRSQYGTELEVMISKGLWTTNSPEYRKVAQVVDRCRKMLDKGASELHRATAPCDDILQTIVQLSYRREKLEGKQQGGGVVVGEGNAGGNTCINIYDVRLRDTAPACGMNWPPTLAPTYAYLARADVRQALHVDNKHKPEAWVECNNNVGGAMRSDSTSAPSVTLLPKLLESGLKVLLFAGEEDLICNAIGVRRTAENLVWGGQKGFGAQQSQPWHLNHTEVGSWKEARNLSYVGIKGASHMVGFDAPLASHDMMLRWMGVDFWSVAGPNARLPSRVGGGPDRMIGATAGAPLGSAQDEMAPDAKTKEEIAEEAKWEAYYNAGSLALVVLLIAVALGTFVLLRMRRKRRPLRTGALPKDRMGRNGHLRLSSTTELRTPDDEERPMELERLVDERRRDGSGSVSGSFDDDVGRRDKERIFDVGESDSGDDEEGEGGRRRRDAGMTEGA